MARFDVRQVSSKGRFRFALELQSEDIGDLPTVIVAPLIGPDDLARYHAINPVFDVSGQPMALRIEQLVGVPRDRLGSVVCSWLEHEFEITRALDRLLSRA